MSGKPTAANPTIAYIFYPYLLVQWGSYCNIPYFPIGLFVHVLHYITLHYITITGQYKYHK